MDTYTKLYKNGKEKEPESVEESEKLRREGWTEAPQVVTEQPAPVALQPEFMGTPAPMPTPVPAPAFIGSPARVVTPAPKALAIKLRKAGYPDTEASTEMQARDLESEGWTRIVPVVAPKAPKAPVQ